MGKNTLRTLSLTECSSKTNHLIVTLESGIGMKNADLGVVTRMRMQELQPIGRHYPHHQRKIHENSTPAPGKAPAQRLHINGHYSRVPDDDTDAPSE